MNALFFFFLFPGVFNCDESVKVYEGLRKERRKRREKGEKKIVDDFSRVSSTWKGLCI